MNGKGKTITKNKKQKAQNSSLSGRGSHEVPPPARELLAIGDAGGGKNQFSSGMQALRGSGRWSYTQENTGSTMWNQCLFVCLTWNWAKIVVWYRGEIGGK